MPDGEKTTWMVIGMGLGFIGAVLLIKGGYLTLTEQTPTQGKYGFMKKEEELLAGWRPLQHIPRVGIEVVDDVGVDSLGPSPTINNLGVDNLSINKETISTEELIDNNKENSNQGTNYNNSEKWIVKRDPVTNRIIGYEIDRKAKIG